MKYDIIILGGGAAGLMAMNELLKKGYRICLLEASNYIGGRIATIKEKGFDQPLEAGAEFIHGKLKLTLKLCKEAGIHYQEVGGQMIGVEKGIWNKKEEHDEHWSDLLQRLRHLKQD